jgi:light-regulated signal transduction histidine kinase (bacteriophytochrome)
MKAGASESGEPDSEPKVQAIPRQHKQNHAGAPVIVVTSFNSLRQNLVGNAIKYRRPDIAPVVDIQARREKTHWLFLVSDNGIGIAPEYTERIFGLFKRLHTGDEYSGTGIGLAICQRIVERYHGRIWVESEVGKGSSFCFTLPA